MPDDVRGGGGGILFGLAALVAAVMIPLGTVGVVALVADDDDAGAVTESTEPTVIEVSLTEFAIEGDLTAPEGPVVLRVTNDGSAVHNLAMTGGPSTPDINPGESADLDLGTLAAGDYELVCLIAGHESAGMKATLTVGGAAGGSGGGSHEGHGGDDVDYAQLDQAMIESILRFPADTEGRGNQPLEPTILEDGTKQFELTTSIIPWEVEPGKVVDAWAYNGQVPGPLIELDVGDRVRVILHNQLPMGTDVHWHGVRVPNSMDGVAPITQPLIEPGQDFVYEFTATEPAIGMYHAHHHGQMQVPNGLFGTIRIGETPVPAGRTIGRYEIPEDVEISQEFPMVLNDAGVIGFSLNGKSFPATEPIVAERGEWIVVHYYNEGLQVHPMHLHQFPQLVFAKDGHPLDEPYWADVVNVAPGERYSILFKSDDPGTWVWHCHILNHVEREDGMFGMVTALIVE